MEYKEKEKSKFDVKYQGFNEYLTTDESIKKLIEFNEIYQRSYKIIINNIYGEEVIPLR